MDELLNMMEIDLSAGLEVYEAAHLPTGRAVGALPLLIRGARAEQRPAVARFLREYYPALHPVKVWNGEMLSMIKLDALEQHDWADYEVSLYLAPVPASKAGEVDPRQWRTPRWPLDPLVEVMALLRAPGGCPWDREQTHESLRRYMLEEAYEVVEAVDSGDPAAVCEELGDVLLQVVFHAQVAREAGRFDIHDVVRGITEKLVRRHPHVFGDVVARTAADVTRNWEAIKREEKGGKEPDSLLSGVSKAQPALSRAHELQRRAAKVGFDWEDAQGPAEKVREELGEVLSAAPAEQPEELGDLLFAVVNLARMLKVDPEVALTEANAKFERRFRSMEQLAASQGRSLADMDLLEMDRLWEESKRTEFGKK